MRLLDRLTQRHLTPSVGQAVGTFQGQALIGAQQTWSAESETPLSDFASYVADGYQSNGVVFACVLARMMLFSEVEFAFQALQDRRLFGSPALRVLERPWPNGTTGEMLARLEQDVSLAGNAYLERGQGRNHRMRPDWVEIIRTRDDEGRPTVGGYLYTVGGPLSGNDARFLTVDDVMHWSPIPDPLADYRGMSWLTPVAREITSDSQMNRHKSKFFENAATPNLLVRYPEALTKESREMIRESFAARHASVDNAYRTAIVDAGADVTVIGNNFEQMSFATVQAAGENRIATAAGVPAIVVGLKEGLQAATYSNFGQAMRRFADLWARPQWRSACSALESVVDVPAGSRLWYRDGHVAALQQDAKDAAEIRRVNATTVQSYVTAGFTPESAVAAVTSGDMSKLVHTGLYSVQLQPPMPENQPAVPQEDA